MDRLRELLELTKPAGVTDAIPPLTSNKPAKQNAPPEVKYRKEQEPASTATTSKRPRSPSPPRAPTKTAPSHPRIAGPSMPPVQYQHEQSKTAQSPKKDKPQQLEQEFVEDDVTEWLPPLNQRGDGTTSLNQKLGY